MDRKSWLYIWCILGLGGVLAASAWPRQPVTQEQVFLFGLLVLASVIAQQFEADFGRQSFYPHLVFFFAGVVLLSPFLFVLLITLPHLLEWTKKRVQGSPLLRDWYLQPFNIATHIIAGISAKIVFGKLLMFLPGSIMPIQLSASMAAAVAYGLVNHALVGQALVWARGIPWSKSRILHLESLGPDFILLTLGYTVAILWTEEPWLIFPVLTPLVLIYRALMVPKLQREARMDQKTGLLNARYFDDRFQEAFARSQRYARPLSIIMADLDLLRDINNTYGHLAGDVVITGIASIIQSHIRDYDIAGRFGGEEFAIVLPETSTASALLVAERLRQAVSAAPFIHGERAIHATMSLGVASFPADGNTPEELIHEADIALYWAKAQGRNQVAAVQAVPAHFRLAQEKTFPSKNKGTPAYAEAPAVSNA